MAVNLEPSNPVHYYGKTVETYEKLHRLILSKTDSVDIFGSYWQLTENFPMNFFVLKVETESFL